MSLADILREREAKAEAHRLSAVAEARRLTAFLRKRFEFEAIYLFGSVLSRRFRRRSDLDMAIKGLKPQDFFKAYAFLIRESAYTIDLKPFEDMPEDMQEKIEREGERIG